MSSSKDPKNTPEAEEKKKNDPLGDDFLSSSLDDIFNDLEGGLGSGKGGLSASTGNSSQKDASTPVDLGAETQKAPTPKLSKTASQTSLPSVPKTPAPTKKTTKRATSSILPAIPKTPVPSTLAKKEVSAPAAPVVKTTAPEKKEPPKVTAPVAKEPTKAATPATKESTKVTAPVVKEPAKPTASAKAEAKKEPTLSVAAASETAPTIPDVPALTMPVVNVELPEEKKPSKVEAKPPKAEVSEPPKVMGKEDKKEKTFDAVAPTVEYSPDERLIEKMATLPPEPETKVEPPKAPEKKVEPPKAPEKKVEPPKAPEKEVEPPKTAKAPEKKIESKPAAPVKKTEEKPATPVKKADEKPVVPVAKADEKPATPVKKADEKPATPVKKADEKPAPTAEKAIAPAKVEAPKTADKKAEPPKTVEKTSPPKPEASPETKAKKVEPVAPKKETMTPLPVSASVPGPPRPGPLKPSQPVAKAAPEQVPPPASGGSPVKSAMIFGAVFFVGLFVAKATAPSYDATPLQSRIQRLERGQESYKQTVDKTKQQLQSDKVDKGTFSSLQKRVSSLTVQLKRLQGENKAQDKQLVTQSAKLRSLRKALQAEKALTANQRKQLRLALGKDINALRASASKLQKMDVSHDAALALLTKKHGALLGKVGLLSGGLKRTNSSTNSRFAKLQRARALRMQKLRSEFGRVHKGLAGLSKHAKKTDNSIKMIRLTGDKRSQEIAGLKGVTGKHTTHLLQADKKIATLFGGLKGLGGRLGETNKEVQKISAGNVTHDWMLKRVVSQLSPLTKSMKDLKAEQKKVAATFSNLETKVKADSWVLTRVASSLPKLAAAVKRFQKNEGKRDADVRKLSASLPKVEQQVQQLQRSYFSMSKGVKQFSGRTRKLLVYVVKKLRVFGGALQSTKKGIQTAEQTSLTNRRALRLMARSLAEARKATAAAKVQDVALQKRFVALAATLKKTQTSLKVLGTHQKALVHLQARAAHLRKGLGLAMKANTLLAKASKQQTEKFAALSKELKAWRARLEKGDKAQLIRVKKVESTVKSILQSLSAWSQSDSENKTKIAQQMEVLSTEMTSLKKQDQNNNKKIKQLQTQLDSLNKLLRSLEASLKATSAPSK